MRPGAVELPSTLMLQVHNHKSTPDAPCSLLAICNLMEVHRIAVEDSQHDHEKVL